MYALAFQRVILEAIFDLFYFPIWWYTFGMFRAAAWCFGVLEDGNEYFAPGIWVKNLFVPMYGQYDWQGRIISFFMRLIQIIFRTIALLIWLLISALFFVGYLAIPVVLVWGIVWGYK